MKQVQGTAKAIIKNVEQVIVGKRQQIVYSLVSWFSEGHILLEDVPGVAKTMLARALAKSVGCEFKRVQCTPDLLPTDVTGASIFNQKTNNAFGINFGIMLVAFSYVFHICSTIDFCIYFWMPFSHFFLFLENGRL